MSEIQFFRVFPLTQHIQTTLGIFITKNQCCINTGEKIIGNFSLGKVYKHFAASMSNDCEKFDGAVFDAYVTLREIVQKYHLEKDLKIPRIVFVGETSSGKSMLVQNFLRFPCAFSQSDVATRCPVVYRLRYNPTLNDDQILIKQPSEVTEPEKLSSYLSKVMRDIGRKDGFSFQERIIHIESNKYQDFEILDIPGLVCGSKDTKDLAKVEEIIERYVRDPTFLIVQLKEANQPAVNSIGPKRIGELCKANPAVHGSTFPPRDDYESYTITVQTKFDMYMSQNRNASHVNQFMKTLEEHFNHKNYYVSMILKAYDFEEHDFKANCKYIDELPRVEKKHVDEWIDSMRSSRENSSSSSIDFDEKQFRPLIGIDVVRNQIQKLWARAFREAFPTIRRVIQTLIRDKENDYNNLIRILEKKNLTVIRDIYGDYVRNFRRTYVEYIAARAESYDRFDFADFSRTYHQIEEEFNIWERKLPIKWYAHKIAPQMLKEASSNDLKILSLPLVGAQHLERIRQVFSYMILTYRPKEHSDGWLTSAQSHLYGVVADNAYDEKSMREALQVMINEVFKMGLCWLTQMYSFMLEHFEKHVVRILLGKNDNFFILRTGHHKFLSYLHLDYHRSTRKMLRHAVEACRNARYSRVQYVSHGIIDFLRALINSIPRSIIESTDKESNFTTLIHGTQTVLPPRDGKDSQGYFPQVRNTIHEYFSVVRGLLLQDVIMYFSANLICHIQQLDSVKIKFELTDRLDRMSRQEIAAMSDVDYERHQEELEANFLMLVDLDQAARKIDHASRLFQGNQSVSAFDTAGDSGSDVTLHRRIRHDRIIKTVSASTDRDETLANITSNPLEKSSDPELDDLRAIPNDANSCEQLLLSLFKEHDKEDLDLSLLDGEMFSWDINRETETGPMLQYHDLDSQISDSTSSDGNVSTYNGDDQDD